MSAIQYLEKMLSKFHKNYPDKPRAISLPINFVLPMTKPAKLLGNYPELSIAKKKRNRYIKKKKVNKLTQKKLGFLINKTIRLLKIMFYYRTILGTRVIISCHLVCIIYCPKDVIVYYKNSYLQDFGLRPSLKTVLLIITHSDLVSSCWSKSL